MEGYEKIQGRGSQNVFLRITPMKRVENRFPSVILARSGQDCPFLSLYYRKEKVTVQPEKFLPDCPPILSSVVL